MIDSAPAASAAPETSAAPLLSRIRDTFVAPARLFRTLPADNSFIAVLVVATLLAAAAVAAEPAEYFLAQVEDPVSRRGTPVEITSSPETVVLWGRIMAVFSALVGHPLLALGGAGLLLLIFRTLGPGDAGYRGYLTVASHGLLISSAGMVAAVLLRLVTGNVDALPTVGTLAGIPAAGLAGGLLHGINLFTLWMLVVVGTGVAAIESRVTRGAATALLLGIYAALVVTWAALFRA